MRLVDDDRATPGRKDPGRLFPALLGHPDQTVRYEGEFLQRRDDDRHAAREGPGELARTLVDLPHDAAPVLELMNRVLQLPVEHHAVGHHDHAVEDLPVVRIVQRREAVDEPGDGIALAAAGGMFDQRPLHNSFGCDMVCSCRSRF